jgi:hypothetical protein
MLTWITGAFVAPGDVNAGGGVRTKIRLEAAFINVVTAFPVQT